MKDFSQVWLEALDETMKSGVLVAPRGKLTREIPQRTISVNMQTPVLRVSRRQLNYRFMAAEAFWILSGSDRVAEIAPYNSRIANFSDDGETFFGAYGPKIIAQLPFVLAKLQEDPMSRQAGLTIWRESPRPTKDVPCTVAIFFNQRDGKLNCHVFMRSSDLWLGLPYDTFNFSMLTHYLCGLLNESAPSSDPVMPGVLHLTAASSHLYETNFEDAKACVTDWATLPQPVTPFVLWQKPDVLMGRLADLRDAKPGHDLRWWEQSDAPQ